ncbi:MAG: NADH-quinone oxidoreductase subunit C [Acidobacteria bacterium]|nr:NADH-quinone oxidoreductase subunit C [Acidobacteriota bacterium]
MNDLDRLVRTLTEDDLVTRVTRPRPGEVHGRVNASSIRGAAEQISREPGGRLILMAGDDRRVATHQFLVHYVFAHPRDGWLVRVAVPVTPGSPSVPSLAPFHYAASRFEREIRDQFGIEFAGHPDPRPLVRHAFWPEDYHPLRTDEPARHDFVDDGRPFPFTEVGGEGVYEIPVGPVHAGVIEPGHFRFSVLGETIIDMKSRLYFTHKGTEKLFEGRRAADGVELAERISGDTSVGHALAYAQAVEAATLIEAPPRAQYLRVILLELERLYNHVTDFGAIANDTGFAVAHAQCYRIREGLLRLNKQVTGSRLLRGSIVPGGVAKDLADALDVASTVEAALKDFEEVVSLCLQNTLLVDRLEGTGALDSAAAADFGVLGYVARASGLDIDARRDQPFAAYGHLAFDVPVFTTGDVKARALVRVEEARQAVSLVRQACRAMPAGPLRAPSGTADPYEPAFGIVEGWRGRIVHMVAFADDTTLHRVKVVDPSFFNWPALSVALMDNIVPDFPLCNKSFNQSYSGNDL